MVKKVIISNEKTSDPGAASPVEHLDLLQIERLTQAFESWFDSATSDYIRRVRGRYWLSFLMLRFTGARIGEVLRVDDTIHIDFERNEIMILNPTPSPARYPQRRIPVPTEVVSRLIAYLTDFPKMRGRVFALDQGNFRREFYKRAEEAEIPKKLSHPHILRHTRAIEMLRAGVPLTTVQEILGHSLSSTTTIYLQRSEVSARRILRDKGLL